MLIALGVALGSSVTAGAFDVASWKAVRGTASTERFLMLPDLLASRRLIGRDRDVSVDQRQPEP